MKANVMKPNVKGWRHRGEKDKEPLLYRGCGLDDVYLMSGYEKEETPDGEGVSIKNLDELHQAIGRYLAQEKKVLSGKELRFLRLQMDLTQSHLARFLGMDSQSVARWEKGQFAIPGAADLVVRALFLELFDNKNTNLKELAQSLEEMDARIEEKTCFENSGKGWKKAVNQ